MTTYTNLRLGEQDWNTAATMADVLIRYVAGGQVVDSMDVKVLLERKFGLVGDHHFYAQVLSQMVRFGRADLISGSGMYKVRIK